MAFETVLFDLDGTLTDNGVGITRCVQHAMAELSLRVPDDREVHALIGPPLIRIFPSLGVPDTLVGDAIVRYRERYGDVGWRENVMYEGVPSMLAEVEAAGYVLAVATSKAEVFAEQILEHFGLRRHFDRVGGASLDSTRSEKADVIAHVLPEAQRVSAVMVGDRDTDVLGARAHGIDCIGVLWGYGSVDELSGAGVVGLARRPDEVLGLISR